MNEISKLIEYYSSEYYFLYSSLSEKQWGNKQLARYFLDKYYLTVDEYLYCNKLKDKIFLDRGNKFPPISFPSSFSLLITKSNSLFDSKSLELFRYCLIQANESYFYVIENRSPNFTGVPLLKFKFPRDIGWDELMSGNFISTILFEMPHNDYFVFGINVDWGVYVSNEFQYPMRIVGFNDLTSAFFYKTYSRFNVPAKDLVDILPIEMIKKIII